ncbi:MAG: glycosyltransferase [Bacteroidia bacterium]|nr:glycosyltransferase [Bacteroidia bacterium]
MRKKVLIVAYYWPPSGGGGVQRWVKFVKYLRQFGWEPIVYVPENADYPQHDEELERDIPQGVKVVKGRIWEPYDIYRSLVGKRDGKPQMGSVTGSKGLMSKLLFWVRGNFFIPDAKVFWVKPSVKRVKNVVKHEQVDAVITTGPPHSVHLIGYHLKRKLDLAWVADFRDPWMHLDNMEEFGMSGIALRKQRAWQKRVVSTCDRLITLTNHEKESNVANKAADKIAIIPNGYDESDFESIESADTNKFILGHYGTAGADRNHPVLYQALQELVQENEAFEEHLLLRYAGPTHEVILNDIRKAGLENNFEYIPYLEHKQALINMKQCSALLLLINNNRTAKSRLTGKIFEYLAMNVPILGIGAKEGEADQVIQKTESGAMFEAEDLEQMKAFISDRFSDFLNGKRISETNSMKQSYTRENLTRALADLLDSL